MQFGLDGTFPGADTSPRKTVHCPKNCKLFSNHYSFANVQLSAQIPENRIKNKIQIKTTDPDTEIAAN